MTDLSLNSRAIVETLGRLGMADREMLTALCSVTPKNGRTRGFRVEGVKKAIRELKASGHLKWLYLTHDPMMRTGFGSKREIYFPGPESAKLFGWNERERQRTVQRMVRYADREWKLRHDLMVTRLHAQLLLLEREYPHVTLKVWEEGVGVNQTYETDHGQTRRLRFTPDARFLLVSRGRGYWYFLEADRGTEQQESHELSERTIAGKVYRYAALRNYELAPTQYPGMGPMFNVLFLSPRRSRGFERLTSLRERNMIDTARRYARELATTSMFRFMSESDIRYDDPGWLLGPVLYTTKENGHQVPIVPPESSQEEAKAAS